MKGGVHLGSVNIIYLLQIPINYLITPNGDGMFMPFVNNLANRRLQSVCINSLDDLFKYLMVM